MSDRVLRLTPATPGNLCPAETALAVGEVQAGDGRVFVSVIHDAYRIRTDERGDSAV
jgi:hypothetical protein